MTQKKKKSSYRRIKAWAVLVSKNQTDAGGKFCAFGNGLQFQYPVFQERKEAISWRNEDRNTRGKIVRCEITYSLKGKK